MKTTGTVERQKRGPKQLLPPGIEEDIVEWIAAMQRRGWPVDRAAVIHKACQVLSLHAGIPRSVSRGWYQKFCTRNPRISERLAQRLSKSRNKVDKEDIKNAVKTYLRAFNAVSLPRAKAISIAGEAFNKLRSRNDLLANERRELSGIVQNGFRTCGTWPLSLPLMLKRLALQTSNGVDKDIGAATWIRTQVAAREDVLTVPARHTGKERKRVSTDDEWFSMAGLHAASSIPNKRKKAFIANRRKKIV
ncbi:hypothetical protein B5M09_013496 [Aphanomyces astaci]|uniref:HTH CENPB-type domain-containing protein n=1 Tax=Aphanomyces astaci TaxID=112090 RepID=A0A425CWZ0_APHAT|nr:hypothetical protein B5M09_013496 [Aphanomyces astaci]